MESLKAEVLDLLTSLNKTIISKFRSVLRRGGRLKTVRGAGYAPITLQHALTYSGSFNLIPLAAP